MDGFISETARQGAFFILFALLSFFGFEEIFLSFHFLRRFMHTAVESQHSNLWCHQDLQPGAAAWTTNQTFCRFIQCLLDHTQISLIFFVAPWDLSYDMGMCPVMSRKSSWVSCFLFVCSHSPTCWLGDLYFASLEVYFGGATYQAVVDNNEWQKTNSSG